MTIQTIIRGMAAGLLIHLIFAGAGWAQDGGNTQAVPVAVEAGADWRAKLNKRVFARSSWSWVLHSMERTGDTLTIRVGFRNGSNAARPMFLGGDYQSQIFLVDERTAKKFPLRKVEGLTTLITEVGRRKIKYARFTFDYPEGSSKVRFESRWITMLMMGAAEIIDVTFPITLPPEGAEAL